MCRAGLQAQGLLTAVSILQHVCTACVSSLCPSGNTWHKEAKSACIELGRGYDVDCIVMASMQLQHIPTAPSWSGSEDLNIMLEDVEGALGVKSLVWQLDVQVMEFPGGKQQAETKQVSMESHMGR